MKKLAVFALVLLALGACKKKDGGDTPTDNPDDPSLLGQDGTDTTAAESDSQLLVSSLVAPSVASSDLTLASTTDGDLGTQGIGDGAKAFFFPRGCLVAANDTAASTVTYTFTKCAGPNGLYKISGVVKVHYTSETDKLTLDVVGDNLTLNRATADWHATAVITKKTALERAMDWNATLSGVGAHGREFTRTVQNHVEWKVGEKCFSINGTSEGDVKGRAIKTEIESFSRCQGACPEAGGKIRITNLTNGKAVELDFDGTANASLIVPNGQTINVPLFCSE